MYRLSLVQALSLWTDLEATLRAEHSYGGDVAEIYMYRLMARSPSVERYVLGGCVEPASSFIGEEGRTAIREANESLLNLLLHFARERQAHIEIERWDMKSNLFCELGDWLRTANFNHRVHVRIRPQGSARV
jgi:hypothetical protein